MPSSDFIKKHGIKRVVVRSEYINDDLSHVLLRYQNNGIDIYIVREINSEPQKLKIRKPTRFKSLSYRFKVMFGLKRNSTGGFGSYILEPSDSVFFSRVG